MTEPTQPTNIATPNQVYVPRGWSEPTHQPGDHIWHDCYEYEVTGAAPNHPWELWSYTVIPVGHSHKPDYMQNSQGYLLEHQVGKERPAYCDQRAGG